ncbi:MAG: hypothetical protein Q8868_06530 [Bacteroidota bacterium]|nr:hypothetical protein [Bacteroidota bacterium]
MGFKLNRYHHNYFYWIYPIIFLGLAIYAFEKDKHDRESAIANETIINADTLKSSNQRATDIENLRFLSPCDSIPFLYVPKD